MQSNGANKDPRDGKTNYTIDYGIDRYTLNSTGISNAGVDKLYR